jgi:hypothetical protein
MYLNARQAAADHRLAAGFSAATGNLRQAHTSSEAADYHDRRADQVRSQLVAARKLGLGGSAGLLPRNYHGDSTIADPLDRDVPRQPDSQEPARDSSAPPRL